MKLNRTNQESIFSWSDSIPIKNYFPSQLNLIQRHCFKWIAFVCVTFFSIVQTNGQIVINEILPDGTVELKNTGTSIVDVSGYFLCDFPAYQSISNSTLDCGNMMMMPGSLLTVNNFNTIDGQDGEMGLYSSPNYTNPDAMVDYVEWGSTGHQRSSVAVNANIWTDGDFVASFVGSLSYDGEGDSSTDWSSGTSTICEDNEPPCSVNGGIISTNDPTNICVDGIGDPINVALSQNIGSFSAWVITDTEGEILGLPQAPPFDLDGAGVGVCQIWHLSYSDMSGLVVGQNVNDLVGCYSFSNDIRVNRTAADGGMISSADGNIFEIGCVGDVSIDVSFETDANSLNYYYVITDDNDNILAWADSDLTSTLDLSAAPVGECHIWGWSFQGQPIIQEGDNISTLNLLTCSSVSDNFLTVIRTDEGICNPDCEIEEALISTSDQTTICVDGISDPINVTVEGGSGNSNSWIITNNIGTILALPVGPPFDLDGAGPGICELWYLSYDDNVNGLETGENIGSLEGCFALSNRITVTRNQPVGGTLEGGRYEFCVNDNEPDNVSGITLTGNAGSISQWVVTDDQGNILGLPPMPSAVNFEGAGPGVCLIWHLSFEDGLQGAAVGMNANDLDGCYSLSNPITVNRFEGNDCSNLCNINGGYIAGGPFEFCVGDGIADNVSGIALEGNSGSNSQWVVTDDQGTILGLPPMPSAVDFDGAGPGTCLIWHLSFEDGLQGAAVGMNANDLIGCFDLSNPITVIRNQPEGGTIAGGPFEFCVDDGIADNVSGISLTGNSGTNSQWVVTDDQGNILGLPPMPSAVNFEGAGPGTCLIWHLSFEDGLQGAEVGMNANDLEGCYSLSNPITVVRNTNADCTTPCNVIGGMITGGPFEFCVGDGIADNVSGITLAGNSGSNSQWVVTDDQGNILGLPPMPSAVDFDGAGPGTCLIWHLSFEDGLQGAEVGMNANELQGCFSLSNPITVIRNQPEGGMLAGGPFELKLEASYRLRVPPVLHTH